jgi:undecaprenyl-diphosphatase
MPPPKSRMRRVGWRRSSGSPAGCPKPTAHLSTAILPGISRSGSTVLTGLWRRIDPVAAAEFSFLMSIPAIVGAAILMVPKIGEHGAAIGTGPLLAGSIAAGVCGILAIRVFVALLRRQNFHTFAYYCWLVAASFLLRGPA